MLGNFGEDCAVKTAREVSRVTWIGLFVNVFLTIGKFLAGVFGNSSALVADAAHSLTDLATDAAILIGARYWAAPADDSHPYGHRKIETMVTFIIGAVLALAGLGLGWSAIDSVVGYLESQHSGNHKPAPEKVALLMALLSVVAKEILYRWTARRGTDLKSTALLANAWHHRSDAFSSIPVVLAVGGAEVGEFFGKDLSYLDPLGALVVCVLVVQSAWHIVKPTLGLLLDEGADAALREKIIGIVSATPGVRAWRNLRTQQLGPHAVKVDIEVHVDRDITLVQGHDIAREVKYRLMDGLSVVVDVMVHIEPVDIFGHRVSETVQVLKRDNAGDVDESGVEDA